MTGTGYEPRGSSSRGREVPPDSALLELLAAAALCSDARLEADGEGGLRLVGDPTEGALLVAAAKAGLDLAALERGLPRAGEIPFSSEAKRMTTLHRGPEGPSPSPRAPRRCWWPRRAPHRGGHRAAR